MRFAARTEKSQMSASARQVARDVRQHRASPLHFGGQDPDAAGEYIFHPISRAATTFVRATGLYAQTALTAGKGTGRKCSKRADAGSSNRKIRMNNNMFKNKWFPGLNGMWVSTHPQCARATEFTRAPAARGRSVHARHYHRHAKVHRCTHHPQIYTENRSTPA